IFTTEAQRNLAMRQRPNGCIREAEGSKCDGQGSTGAVSFRYDQRHHRSGAEADRLCRSAVAADLHVAGADPEGSLVLPGIDIRLPTAGLSGGLAFAT